MILSTPNPKLMSYFKDYASYHRTPGNQACHYVGIPVILISLLGMLSYLGMGDASGFLRLDGGILLWAIGSFWYVSKDWKWGVVFGALALGMYFIAREVPVQIHIAAFLLGWAIQYVGHYRFEKKSPAFYKNAEHLLVGPIWIFSKLLGHGPKK
jgi:uncharacterized membrane protein YGL010W